ncbi:hypothetical protein SAZ11_13905 [Streptomyces sp. FXJ1.4098]|nr:hypothetical protein [Streptomyces sp. FXJ1.4098]
MEKFNVVALGPSGSGKTVYLAALQERLRTQDPELGFHVRLPRDQERKLTEVYSEVASSGDWPAPTDRTETPSGRSPAGCGPGSGCSRRCRSSTSTTPGSI